MKHTSLLSTPWSGHAAPPPTGHAFHWLREIGRLALEQATRNEMKRVNKQQR